MYVQPVYRRPPPLRKCRGEGAFVQRLMYVQKACFKSRVCRSALTASKAFNCTLKDLFLQCFHTSALGVATQKPQVHLLLFKLHDTLIHHSIQARPIPRAGQPRGKDMDKFKHASRLTCARTRRQYWRREPQK